MVLVAGRLQPSERIIVEGVQKVREGQRVSLVQPSRPAPQRATLRPTPTPTPTGNAP